MSVSTEVAVPLTQPPVTAEVTSAPEADFAEFYAATHRVATAQVFAMIGNWHEAQEAVQEAYARALARWAHVSRYDEPLAWVRTVAYRVSVSRWRKARRLVLGTERDTEVPAPLETHVALVAGLQRLPQAQREALVLHYLADLPVAQIAAQLGVPEGTVKARLSRGRAAMALLIAEEDTDD
ncbi:MAG: SigE family RNA polymerase sigma factor [Geodermatophilaceae bacterium]|nr:SigE family RNA polymerase sigma factor [Geodermatophilaceae bacterium]